MFRRVVDIWKCLASEAHCGYFGPMCVAPPRVIYWANCHKDIITYNFDTNILKNLYQHSTYIQHLFWYHHHLYFIDDNKSIHRLDDPTSVVRIGTFHVDVRTIGSCWTDNNWNVYIQNDRKIYQFNGESFITSENGLLKISEEENILIRLDDTIITVPTPTGTKKGFSHIMGHRYTGDTIILYTEDYIWDEIGSFIIRKTHSRKHTSKQIILTSEIFPSRCLNPTNGEIYVIDEYIGQYYISIYEYPLRSLLDLCIEVIMREETLRLQIVKLPEDLRDRFSGDLNMET